MGNETAGSNILKLIKPSTMSGNSTAGSAILNLVKPVTVSGANADSPHGAEVSQNVDARTALLKLCGARDFAESDQQTEVRTLSRQELLNFMAACPSERPPTPMIGFKSAAA